MSKPTRTAAPAALLMAAALCAASPAAAATLHDLYPPGRGPGAGPRAATSLWRVPVAGGPWASRCADGTEPVIYVRRSAGPRHANDWIFHIPGGGSGADADELLERWTHGEHTELSSRWANESKKDDGIFSGDPANPFREWNMVAIDKCTMDRFLGTRRTSLTTTRDVATPAGTVAAGTAFDMWFHGALIVEDAVALLKSGVSYRDHAGALVSMPSLAGAATILWTGSSGGSRGALMSADRLRESVFPASAEVKLVAEAGFDAGAELLLDAQSRGWATGSIYDGSHGFDALTGTSSDVQFDTVGRAQIDAWGAHAVIDQSCLSAHLSEQWRCYEEAHVLMNHVATPFFVRQDLYDRNHLTPCWQVGWRAAAADCYLGAAPPLENARRHAAAVTWQLADLGRFLSDHDEGSFTVAPVGFGPRCGQHVGLTNREGFFANGIEDPVSGVKVTFAAALDAWVRGRGMTLVESSAFTASLPAACR
jgi:hypothetical protein